MVLRKFRQNQNNDDYFKMIAKMEHHFCLKNVNAHTTLNKIFNKNALKSFTVKFFSTLTRS